MHPGCVAKASDFPKRPKMDLLQYRVKTQNRAYIQYDTPGPPFTNMG